MDTVAKFFRVLQDLSPCFQLVIFTGHQLCLGDFLNLVTERFHSAELFTLVHGHTVDFTTDLCYLFIFIGICLTQSTVVRKCVKI